MPLPQVFNDAELNSRFHKKGFVHIPLLSEEELEDLKARLFALSPSDGFQAGPNSNHTGGYHCTFLDGNQEYKKRANELILDVFSPHFDSILHDFGIVNGNFYVKPPQKGRFHMHQNWHHVPEPHHVSLTAWVPFQDITPQNGGLRIVEGSHKIVPDIGTFGVPYYFANLEDYLIEEHLVPLFPKAGECVLFEDSMIHWSETNTSEKDRIAVQIEMLPKSIKPVIYLPGEEYGKRIFYQYEIGKNFFIREDLTSWKEWALKLPLVRKVPNNNRLLTKEEFLEKLEKGPQTRMDLYK